MASRIDTRLPALMFSYAAATGAAAVAVTAVVAAAAKPETNEKNGAGRYRETLSFVSGHLSNEWSVSYLGQII